MIRTTASSHGWTWDSVIFTFNSHHYNDSSSSSSLSSYCKANLSFQMCTWSTYGVIRRCLVKSVPKNFAKVSGKKLCWSFVLNKVEGLTPAALLKKRLLHRGFSTNFAKFLRTLFFIENVWWLLLAIKCLDILCWRRQLAESILKQKRFTFYHNLPSKDTLFVLDKTSHKLKVTQLSTLN